MLFDIIGRVMACYPASGSLSWRSHTPEQKSARSSSSQLPQPTIVHLSCQRYSSFTRHSETCSTEVCAHSDSLIYCPSSLLEGLPWLCTGLDSALVLEDDAIIHAQALDAVSGALHRLGMASGRLGNWTLLSLGAYNSAGASSARSGQRLSVGTA